MTKEYSRVLLLGVYSQKTPKPVALEHLNELNELANTLGIGVIDQWCVPLRAYDAATYLGSGKVEELSNHIQEINADLLVIDDEISPAQQRNLEKLLKIPVIDRTEVILEVFADHAKSKEAQLQIELARVEYEMPRLKRLWTHLSRQKGGGVMSRGEGETQIELDRRQLKKRVERLQEELKAVEITRATQRHARERHQLPLFAIIGYTNSGKSTLLNALTDAGVLVEDKLFATLDTTTRKFYLENNQEVLLTDTVGFIRKLPHSLIEAFKSTLEEALHADVLVHLVDSSHPMVLEQIVATETVLKELKADHKPTLMVLNKSDLPSQMRALLKEKYPDSIEISALKKEGLKELASGMEGLLTEKWPTLTLKIPQSDFKWIHEITAEGHILEQEYVDNDILIRAKVPLFLAGKLQAFIRHD